MSTPQAAATQPHDRPGDGPAPMNGAAADTPEHAYSVELGQRLRHIRQQQRMSLHDVERRSDGRWKAVVVGSYERADRAPSMARIAQLAAFYGVPVSELLPQPGGREAAAASRTRSVMIDLRQLADAPDPAAHLSRYVRTVQLQRGDFGNDVLSLRDSDFQVLSIMYGVTVDHLRAMLEEWGVVREIR